MRTFFLLTLSFYCCYFHSSAQTAIAFHTVMKTGNVYRQTMQTATSVALNYDSMSQELRDALQSNPAAADALNKQQKMLMETEMRCGKADAATGVMPVRMKVTKDTGMIAQVLPVGATFYGHMSAGKMPVFDSTDMEVNGQTQAMLAAMKNVGLQVSFPDTTMSVGQTYTQVMPIDLPAGAMKMKMLMTQTFTLKGFSADTAGFDIRIKGTLDMGGADVPVTGTAEGEGHIIYDRKSDYPTYGQVNLRMLMVVRQGENVMRLTVHSGQITKCVISKE